jgi:hypothetical protein
VTPKRNTADAGPPPPLRSLPISIVPRLAVADETAAHVAIDPEAVPSESRLPRRALFDRLADRTAGGLLVAARLGLHFRFEKIKVRLNAAS